MSSIEFTIIDLVCIFLTIIIWIILSRLFMKLCPLYSVLSPNERSRQFELEEIEPLPLENNQEQRSNAAMVDVDIME